MGSYLSIVVEVGIEANAVMSSRFKVDVHGRIWIVLRKVHIKLKASIGVWSVGWTRYKDLKHSEKKV